MFCGCRAEASKAALRAALRAALESAWKLKAQILFIHPDHSLGRGGALLSFHEALTRHDPQRALPDQQQPLFAFCRNAIWNLGSSAESIFLEVFKMTSRGRWNLLCEWMLRQISMNCTDAIILKCWVWLIYNVECCCRFGGINCLPIYFGMCLGW